MKLTNVCMWHVLPGNTILSLAAAGETSLPVSAACFQPSITQTEQGQQRNNSNRSPAAMRQYGSWKYRHWIGCRAAAMLCWRGPARSTRRSSHTPTEALGGALGRCLRRRPGATTEHEDATPRLRGAFWGTTANGSTDQI
jgi:hypothetical protein